jgi:DNA repair protein RadC
MKEQGGEGVKFLNAVQDAIRARVEKRVLSTLLREWRYQHSSDFADMPLKPASARFLIRFGILDAGKDPAASTKEYHDLLLKISRASGDAPGVVAAWLELFAAGQYSVLQKGICSQQPQCEICNLQEKCRYLAAGGKDARASGKSLAQELVSAGSHGGDLRIADLIAFVIAGDKSGAADIARAEAMLKASGGLRGLLAETPVALGQMGLNNAQAARIQAVAEICRTWADERKARGRSFSCGKDFFDEFHLRLRDTKKEVFVVVMLDQKNCHLADEQISIGSLTETLVHPREVFVQAIALRAAAVALIHNHPSGDPAPSPADKALTKRLDSVAKLVGIRLLDHVIIGDGRFVSFVESGLMSG